MTPVEAAPLRRRPRRGALLAVLALAAGLAAAFVWWTLREPVPGPVEAGWTARVLVLAGDGVAGWRDGQAAQARFADPFGIVAAADGTVYVADAGESQRIRGLSPDGRVFTLAGGAAGFEDGPGTAARFDTPSGLAIDPDGTLYVADTGNHAIRRITPDGRVSTLAGNGVPGYQDGRGPQVQFNGPVGVAFDGTTGRVIVADTYNDVIRTIDPDGTVNTVTELVERPAVGGSSELPLDTPSGVALDEAGSMYIADTGNGLVRRIDATGMLTTLGPLPFGLVRPVGIAATPGGDVYVTDDRGRIVEIPAGGPARTLAGSGPGFRDGFGAGARFRRPAGLAFTEPGRLLVADAGNALIRLVAAPAVLALRPPASPRIAPRFDDEAFGRVPLLWPVAPMDGPHEVAGTLGEARGGEGSERFHAGIDVRVDQGTFVHAVRDGVVVSPVATGDFGSLNEWLRIGPLTYVHVRAGRTRRGDPLDLTRFVPTVDDAGRVVRVRVRRGARFATGDAIATVNAFNHVHLNVGWPGEEHNPLRFRLAQFEDTVAPTISRGGIRLFDEAWQPLTRRLNGRILVSGRVRIVVDAWDQADGNRPGRRLGLYTLGYQVLHRDGSPAPGFEAPLETIRFDRLASGPNAAGVVFAPGSGIPFYGRRMTRFLYTVTNSFMEGVATESFWDTTLHAPGDYILRAWAADFHGNIALENRDVPVTVRAPDPLGEEAAGG